MVGAHTSRRGRGPRKSRARSNAGLHASGGVDLPASPGGGGGGGGGAAGKQGQMVFTVGTFEEDDGASQLLPAGDARALPPNATAAAVAAADGGRPRGQPLFTVESNSEMSDAGSGAEGRAETPREPVRSSSQLHACKATTSLSQLCQPPRDAAPAVESPLPMRLSHVASVPTVAAGATEVAADASDGAQRSRARGPTPRESPARPRKRPSARRLHAKKATVPRTRVRGGPAHRGGPEDRATGAGAATTGSSYVDYSESDAPASDTADAPQASVHSSTATLGTAGHGEDSVTTTSIDSPDPEATQTCGRLPPAGPADPPAAAADSTGPPVTNDPADPPATDDPADPPAAADHRHETGQLAAPQQQQPQRQQPAATGQAAYKSKVTKRNMESQRQQSMVEQEEEDMARASAQLTGIRHRTNHAAGMAPHVFLAPDSLAYRNQISQTDRAYAHVRSVAHPLVASIARCVELRESRHAVLTPRERPRALRRQPAPDMVSPGPAAADWWTPLLPPPRPEGRAQRQLPPGYHRLQSADLPHWALAPHAARGSPAAADDDTCPHIQELRARATELGFVRQHALSTSRSGAPIPTRLHVTAAGPATTTTAAYETWRGRRIPGLLGVDVYAGNVAPRPALSSSLPVSDAAAMLGSPSSDSGVSLRPGQPAPPYRRNGTVYGHVAANAFGASALAATRAANTASSGGGAGPGAPLRRHDSIASSRPHTASIYENDPRRTSYFDRLSMDEDRPRPPSSSTTHQTTVGLFRRVISGFTGGAAALGSSQ